jgi:hypothetical protein
VGSDESAKILQVLVVVNHKGRLAPAAPIPAQATVSGSERCRLRAVLMFSGQRPSIDP